MASNYLNAAKRGAKGGTYDGMITRAEHLKNVFKDVPQVKQLVISCQEVLFNARVTFEVRIDDILKSLEVLADQLTTQSNQLHNMASKIAELNDEVSYLKTQITVLTEQSMGDALMAKLGDFVKFTRRDILCDCASRLKMDRRNLEGVLWDEREKYQNKVVEENLEFDVATLFASGLHADLKISIIALNFSILEYEDICDFSASRNHQFHSGYEKLNPKDRKPFITTLENELCQFNVPKSPIIEHRDVLLKSLLRQKSKLN